jgi:hypothetical protein
MFFIIYMKLFTIHFYGHTCVQSSRDLKKTRLKAHKRSLLQPNNDIHTWGGGRANVSYLWPLGSMSASSHHRRTPESTRQHGTEDRPAYHGGKPNNAGGIRGSPTTFSTPEAALGLQISSTLDPSCPRDSPRPRLSSQDYPSLGASRDCLRDGRGAGVSPPGLEPIPAWITD